MGRGRNIALLVLPILCILELVSSGTDTHHVYNFTCRDAEREALLKFKESFINGSDHRLSSWVKGGDCCRWKGVRCNNMTGHVMLVDLAGNCSSDRLSALKLDSALNELNHLRHLDLSCSNFSGNQIPPFFGSLKNLQYLNLSHSKFSGEIPLQLGNLTQLRSLDLASNGYWSNGNIITLGVHDLKWISGLQSLQHLNLDLTYLSQESAPMKVFLNLPSLITLSLQECHIVTNYSHEFTYNKTSFSGNLKILHLYGNSFQNFPFLANLSSLVFLDLGSNLFHSLPYGLGNLKNIEHLDLSDNHIIYSGEDILGFATERRHLKFLDLSFNIQESSTLSSTRNFSKSIKSSLQHLNMFENNLTGPLPTWLGELKGLRELILGRNKFTGNVPYSLCHLTSLNILDLSYNYLDGILTDAFFANFSDLYYLNLESNFLSIQLLSNWKPPFQIQYLSLRSCRINTTYPSWLQLQKKMVCLDLSDTGIFGPLPKNIGDLWMHSLALLDMADNHLSGSIPTSMCKLMQLHVLNLHNNKLLGLIPNCSKVSHPSYLEYIDLSSNKLLGPIPAWLAELTNLGVVNLSNNSLQGDIPSWRNSAESLTLLDLGENNLSGYLPSSIGQKFLKLEVLRLRDNQISGMIPLQLCSSLPFLCILDLANNYIAGTIPYCFGHFSGMIAAVGYIWGYSFPIAFTNSHEFFKLWDPMFVSEALMGRPRGYKLGNHQVTLTYIDISRNYLVGNIPFELTNLVALIGLNLSSNNLTGPIPPSINKMRALEILDLSNNHLSGTIPQALSALTALSQLNFSHNNLHGQIPTGSQLQTFNDPSIYGGNPGLCGDPLPKKCHGNENTGKVPPKSSATDISDEDIGEERYQKMWFYLSGMMGAATGFWGVIGILFVKRELRYTYFRFGDRVADWMYVKIAVSIARLKRKFR